MTPRPSVGAAKGRVYRVESEVSVLRLGRVVGNVVSTVKDGGYFGQKLMIVEYLNERGEPDGPRLIAFDCADAGVGDTVIVNTDGGAANMFLGEHCIADLTICGVVDYCTMADGVIAGNTGEQTPPRKKRLGYGY